MTASNRMAALTFLAMASCLACAQAQHIIDPVAAQSLYWKADYAFRHADGDQEKCVKAANLYQQSLDAMPVGIVAAKAWRGLGLAQECFEDYRGAAQSLATALKLWPTTINIREMKEDIAKARAKEREQEAEIKGDIARVRAEAEEKEQEKKRKLSPQLHIFPTSTMADLEKEFLSFGRVDLLPFPVLKKKLPSKNYHFVFAECQEILSRRFSFAVS